MRQIAKWTFLCVICTLCGFGATYFVAHSDRVIQTFVAMWPVPSQPTVEELAPAELVLTEKSAVDAVMVDETTVDLATELAAADLPALAPISSSETTVGTFAVGKGQVQSDSTQLTPSGGPLNAVGVVVLVRDRQVVLGASGRVDEITVEVGDAVSAGDLLVGLDTTYLDWAVEQAEIGFESARIDFEVAGRAVQDSDIAVAEANLLAAQENLALVEAGPTDAELGAAESSAAAAWAALEELQAGPNENEIIIAQAELRRAEIAVQAAQREFDKIAWLPESAASSAADDLQSATISYEAAKAAYDESSAAPKPSEIAAATAAAQSAQDALDQLLLRPTAAELALAQAEVASAEDALADLQEEGPQQAALRQAELGVRNAMIALEDARLAQESAQVLAPIDGTVLAVNVDLGQQASAGDVVAVLADTADVKLTVNVEQRDIARVPVGQEVQIAIYALANDTFTGVVEQIAPVADAQTGFVTFPVIIRFTEGPLDKVLPGMTASATFASLDGETPAAAPTAAATVEATAEATPEATEEATEEPTEEATAEATEEATAEPTVEATEEVTAEATEEATEEASEEATEEPTEEATPEPVEEPAAEATATPSN